VFLLLWGVLIHESWKEVIPRRIVALDSFDLLGTGPVLELFFSCDGTTYVAKVFEVDQAMDGVPSGVGGCGDGVAVRHRSVR
jgi:hypothetical protein